MGSSKPVISLSNVSAGYGGDHAIESIDFAVEERDFVGIIGPNGAGKSTLFKVILGLLEPKEGSMKILGKSPKKARSQIGYVPQYVQFDDDFPIQVRDVVLMGRLQTRGLFQRYQADDQRAVEHALEQLELTEFRNVPLSELSIGERRRVYIARALATNPKILLLDEPTDSVDSRIHTKIFDLLRELNKEITILMISHDLGVISSYVKTIACLNKTLHSHSEEILPEVLEEVYQCPVDMIAHGVPHRVLPEHHDS